MSLHADSQFQIGAGHDTIGCQDYAIHGMIGETAYVIGSDGCSSSPKSELGARLLVESARKYLEMNDGRLDTTIKNWILQDLRQLRSMLRLESRNFDATLWIATVCGNNYTVLGWGDGMFVKKFDDGSIETDHVEFTSNAPRYLSYGLDPERYDAYLEQTKGSKVLVHKMFPPDGKGTVQNEVDGFHFHEEHELSGGGKKLTCLAILSDGVTTFKERLGTELFAPEKMAGEVCDFLNPKGVFVQRQISWLKKQHIKKDIIHIDDLFCGAISILD